MTADANAYSLGAAMLQESLDGSWQPAAYASCALTETERNYGQYSGSASNLWACKEFDFYLLGRIFKIESNRKPLVTLLRSKDLCDKPLGMLRLRLMQYQCSKFSHAPIGYVCHRPAV